MWPARYRHVHGGSIHRAKSEVLLKDDLKEFLLRRYADEAVTASEVDAIVRRLEMMSSADLYESNRAVMKMVSDGLLLKREDRNQKDLYIQLIDYSDLAEHVEPADGQGPFASGIISNPRVLPGQPDRHPIIPVVDNDASGHYTPLCK